MDRQTKGIDLAGLLVFLTAAGIGTMQLVQTLGLGLSAFVTMLAIDALALLLYAAAWRCRMPFLAALDAVGFFILQSTMNYAAYDANLNTLFLPQAILATAWAVLGTAWLLISRRKPRKPGAFAVLFGLTAAIAGTFAVVWGVNVAADRNWTGHAKHTLWAVPAKFDTGEIAEAGTVEELVYETKAYATDRRAVKKRALVYLPYGYDETQRYNILYLMHGTGDDENYWLQKNPYNKTMLDRMIASGEIAPLIVVTPTFYVENDCADDLDQLTFSFRDELRNDLMPAVESKYATYAASIDDAGFAGSRDHRAFAGLSRGSVTTTHSAFCGSLDYFSYFGMFSAFRTTEEYLRETIQSGAFRELPIRYLYMTTGNFDFAAPAQYAGYRTLTDTEPRLAYGENTLFDTFPMRYHSMGNWHLALYNCLQKLF